MPLFRRRPLLRAAAVGGGAYMMGKRRAEAEQHEAYQDAAIASAQQPAGYGAPPQNYPAAPGNSGMSSDVIERLKDLGNLHEQGVLTDEEFAQQKAKLLA